MAAGRVCCGLSLARIIAVGGSGLTGVRPVKPAATRCSWKSWAQFTRFADASRRGSGHDRFRWMGFPFSNFKPIRR